jgi:hypothetical protein
VNPRHRPNRREVAARRQGRAAFFLTRQPDEPQAPGVAVDHGAVGVLCPWAWRKISDRTPDRTMGCPCGRRNCPNNRTHWPKANATKQGGKMPSDQVP